MTEYTQLIENLRLGASISRDRNMNLDYAKVADEAAQAIEALQAQAMAYERDIEKFATECAKHGLHDRSPEAAVNLLAFERDNLQAQIAEQDHELADTAFLAGQYKAERDAALAKLKELEAQPSPTALELMREYSNGKQWALEEAAKVAEDGDNIVDVGGYHAQLGDASATQRNIVAAIRKLKEGI